MKYVIEYRQGCRGIVDGREVIVFSSNDYLGLSAHPDVIRAAANAANLFGTGTGGAPGTTGTTVIHEKLERAIASFKSREKAVLFASGYQANQALHHALDSDATIFHVDERHHPSALDGIRLARHSKALEFEHADLKGLKKAILKHKEMRNVVSLPSVFTVDGDIAPLDKLASLKRELEFVLLLDDAHADGCLGASGRGLEEHFHLTGAADFVMGTFSKALASQGGYIAYNNPQASMLKMPLRTFEYSTSLSAVSVAAALRALEMLESDNSLLSNLRRAKDLIIDECKKASIQLIARESMVLLLPCPNCEALQKMLFDQGFLTMPVKAMISNRLTDALRIVPMATHSESDIKSFVAALKRNL